MIFDEVSIFLLSFLGVLLLLLLFFFFSFEFAEEIKRKKRLISLLDFDCSDGRYLFYETTNGKRKKVCIYRFDNIGPGELIYWTKRSARPFYVSVRKWMVLTVNNEEYFSDFENGGDNR